MPSWVNILIAAAAGVTALGILWSKVLHPTMRAASQAEEMLPLLQELTRTFRDNPQGFKVLNEIVAQFRTNGGSSLRDVINRLETAAQASAAATADLQVQIKVMEGLAEQDRRQLARLVTLLNYIDAKVAVGVSGVGLIRQEQSDLSDALHEAQVRADDVEMVDGHGAGAAADAAARSPRRVAT